MSRWLPFSGDRAVPPYKLLSVLLQYPSERLVASEEELGRAIAALPPSKVRGAIERFWADWAGTPALARARRYVETFDLHKRRSLYLSFYQHGDRRQRGLGLVRLKRMFAAAGLIMDGGELPDYLPLMLEFAALAPDGYGETVLAEYRPAIEVLRAALRDAGAPPRRALRGPASPDPAPGGPDRAAGDRGPAGRASRPRAVRAARADAAGGGAPVSAIELFLWIVIPYAATVVFGGGLIWRYRTDQFGWTCRSTQLLENRLLAPGSVMFHYGALAAIAGHVLGILIPESFTDALGITEPYYHAVSAGAGTIASVVTVAGLLILVYRRITVRRVWLTTTALDIVAYVALTVVILLGVWDTLVTNTLGPGYDYRRTVAVWFRSLAIFDPQPALMASAPLLYRVHATAAWLLYALWPFTRLVHAVSYPVQYLGRPYILYRRRFAGSR